MDKLNLSKIVFPDVAGRAEFAFDPEGRYIIDTVYALRKKHGIAISHLALLALLNSSFTTFFLKKTGTNLRGGYFRMKTAYLNPFPLPDISFQTDPERRADFARKAQELFEQFCEKLDDSIMTDFVDNHLNQTPSQSDIVHDLLSFLAKQMTSMKKQSQDRINDFWTDLEGVTDYRTFDNLHDKGKQERTLWKSKACRNFVSEDSHTTRILDESLAWEEDSFKAFVKALVGSVPNLSQLVDVYRHHQPEYKRLDQLLKRTDRLIDQTVYRLYGLTEEEIAIVEGEAVP